MLSTLVALALLARPGNPVPASPPPVAPASPVAPSSPPDDPQIETLPGFEAQLIHRVDPRTQGSWVALCSRPDGTLYATDERDGLFRIAPPPIDDPGAPCRVERVAIDLNGAQGLLWAFDSLYIMASGRGLLRVTDTDADGEVDAPTLIVPVAGEGEHGTHAIALHPDGRSLLIACGNHTPLPATLTFTRPPRPWLEGQLLKRDPDPRGHAVGVMAPGGYICRVAPDGSEVELIACGFRNTYDLAASPAGEIFTFDSDMEWDLGLPWYRPARVCHVVSGADFGWRHGSGKWPADYEESLPPTLDVGPASPTGMAFGTGAAFPPRYRDALFMLDWTYGMIYAVHLTPRGATFDARAQQFLAAKPLPLTDAAVGADGALYFTTGGRRLASSLYRVVYRGPDAQAPALPAPAPTPEARLRAQLEGLYVDQLGSGSGAARVVDEAWVHLAHGDRFVRHSARVALEHQPIDLWRRRALEERDPSTAAAALLALARQGEETDRGALLGALTALCAEPLNSAARMAQLRAAAIVLMRFPASPDTAADRALAEALAALAPALDAAPDPGSEPNSESARVALAELLVVLGHPLAIDACLERLADTSPAPEGWADLARRNEQYGSAVMDMLRNPPPTRGIRYAHILSNVATGWTFQQRQAYFSFLQRAHAAGGGMSYRGFIDAMRERVLATCAEHERAALAPFLRPIDPSPRDAPPATPRGPWREWTVADATRVVSTLRGRSFDRGAGLYRAATCAGCHQFNGSGSNVGPDLTSVGRTYSVEDIVRAIIEPSFAVTDQYAVTVVTLRGGEEVAGLLVGSDEARVLIAPNFAAPGEAIEISRDRVERIERSTTSAMPPGLVNAFSEDDLRDLTAFLLSGGDPGDPMFR